MPIMVPIVKIYGLPENSDPRIVPTALRNIKQLVAAVAAVDSANVPLFPSMDARFVEAEKSGYCEIIWPPHLWNVETKRLEEALKGLFLEDLGVDVHVHILR